MEITTVFFHFHKCTSQKLFGSSLQLMDVSFSLVFGFSVGLHHNDFVIFKHLKTQDWLPAF